MEKLEKLKNLLKIKEEKRRKTVEKRDEIGKTIYSLKFNIFELEEEARKHCLTISVLDKEIWKLEKKIKELEIKEGQK